jgi:hypothetical protein
MEISKVETETLPSTLIGFLASIRNPKANIKYSEQRLLMKPRIVQENARLDRQNFKNQPNETEKNSTGV